MTLLETVNGGAQAAGSVVMSCRDIVARYSRIIVVSNVSFTLRAGEMLAVLGANGAGKSSMLGAIAGIVAGSDEIKVQDRDVGRMSPHKRAANGIAFVPEQRGNIFATMSVKENLDIGLRLLPQGEREAQRDFINDLFPILGRRDAAMVGVLSGGEQQMLAIGLALSRKPSVLILDEPSQGLAPAVFDILEAAFSTLKQNSLALLMAEQNVPFAAQIAERYMILSHGQIVRSGGRKDLQNPEELADAFIGNVSA